MFIRAITCAEYVLQRKLLKILCKVQLFNKIAAYRALIVGGEHAIIIKQCANIQK